MGTLGWAISSNGGDEIVSDWNSHSWAHSAQLGDGRAYRTTSIEQAVRIPYQRSVLYYWQDIESVDLCPFDPGVEFGYLTISINGSEIQHYDICLNMTQIFWETWSLDLSDFAGQTVQLVFMFHSDDQLSSELYIDDLFFRSRQTSS